MLVATFGPGSSCAGRTITFAGEQFVHEVPGPISAAEVMDYDRKGWLEWPMEGMRAGVGSRDEALVPGAGAAREPASVLTPVASSLPRAVWTNRCPACRQATLAPGEAKTPFFGGAPKPVWMCPRCEAQFVQKAAPSGGGPVIYELKRAAPLGPPSPSASPRRRWLRRSGHASRQGESRTARSRAPTSRLPRRPPRRLHDLPAARGRVAARPEDGRVRVGSVPRRVPEGTAPRDARGLRRPPGAPRQEPRVQPRRLPRRAHDELHDVDRGTLVVTSKRYAFMDATFPVVRPRATAARQRHPSAPANVHHAGGS